jgi:putative membrane protein
VSLHQWILFAFTAFYIAVFSIYYAGAANFEFIGYVGVLVFGAILIYVTLPRTQFANHILWGLSLWGLLHLAGGSVRVGDDVLYALKLIPLYDGGGEFYILKMDQLIHLLGFGVAALAIMHLLFRFVSQDEPRRFWLGVVAIFVAMGLGAMNEVIEFSAVVFVPETGVGGYYNTALGLVFNALGATTAVAGVALWRRYRRTRPTTV